MNGIIFFTLQKSSRKLHVFLWGVTEEVGGGCAVCNSNFVIADYSYKLNH